MLAQDADRITRDPAHRAYLDDEFAEHGCRLIALDDWGDDTHEGELLKYLKGWVSKGERLKIAERTRRGRTRRAREGKVLALPSSPYGFRYNDARNGFVVHEPEMDVVRRIFEMVGEERLRISAVKRKLEADGVLSPTGKLLR